MLDFIEKELSDIKDSGLYRSLKTIEKTDGRTVTIDEKLYLNFCSNNYLGLANHPAVVAAAKEAVEKYGTGAGASRLISGNLVLHEKLERKIAEFKKREAAIVFPTGFMANLGVVSALVDEKDTVIIDRLDHASIIDACKLSRAKLQVFPHRDMNALEKLLGKSQNFGKRLIVTDSVFSMDGDLAPLLDILMLAKNHKALVMIDEAHSTGVLGKTGRGLEEHFNCEGRTDIVMGTLSKAIGSLGGFVAGPKNLIDYLRNKSRSFIYTTALPPASCAAALAALELIEKDLSLLEKLRKNIDYYSSPATERRGSKEPGRSAPGSLSPIIPIIIGPPEKTLEISNQLFTRGILLSAIRPPTVPPGQSRLRLTICAQHTKEDIACLASSLRELIPA
ncbi:8-amino-7-oxononanoate synthase [Candidatus Saganbacteria bacterium]|nr:8-amino-7-oxononanoate synthase [Candidatus Saganbacteria bacterium]